MNAHIGAYSQSGQRFIERPPMAGPLGSGGMVQLENVLLSEDMAGVGRKGDRITMAVTPAGTGDQLRTMDTYVAGYRNAEHVADLVSKPFTEGVKEAGKYLRFNSYNAFQHHDARVGRSGAISELQVANDRADYRVQGYGFAAWIPWMSEADAVPGFPVRQITADFLMQQILLDREVRVSAALRTAANWATNNQTQLISTTKWNGGASASPSNNINDLLAATAAKVTMMVCNPNVFRYMLQDTEVRAKMRQVYGDDRMTEIVKAAGLAQEQMVVELFGWPSLLIAPAKVLNDTTGTLEYIWKDDFVLLAQASGKSAVEIASFQTFRHPGRSGTGIVTNEYVPWGRGVDGGTVIEVGLSEDTVFPSNISGGVIKGCIQ